MAISYGARGRLSYLLKTEPNSSETADHLRAYRAQLSREIAKREATLKTDVAKLKAGIDALRTELDALPPDFEGEKRQQVATYGAFGSAIGHTPAPESRGPVPKAVFTDNSAILMGHRHGR